MLPDVPLATAVETVGGAEVPIRSLSRDEVVRLARFGDETGEAEVFILSRACAVTEDEARRWRESVGVVTAGDLLTAIARISGLARGEA